MGSFRVELGPNAHPVHVGAGLLDRLGELAREAGLKPGRAALVTDSNVARLYGARAHEALATAGFDATTIDVAAGEASKSLTTLEQVYDRLVAAARSIECHLRARRRRRRRSRGLCCRDLPARPGRRADSHHDDRAG
jgi:3-dehydroquinate synthetase